MTTTMKNALAAEIDFINGILAYESTDSLELIQSLDEAKVQVEGYMSDYNEDLPEGLTDPETMMLVWNYCVTEEKKAYQAMKVQQYDDQFAAEHPDSIRFRKQYEDGSSCFFDPDALSRDLMRTGYDATHREIIAKALTAYAKTCNQ